MADSWTLFIRTSPPGSPLEIHMPGPAALCSSGPVTEEQARLASAAPELYEALKELTDALEGARAANPEASIEFFEELVEIEPGWRMRVKNALLKANPNRGTNAQ